MGAENYQSRSWIVTIENPNNKGYTDDIIKKKCDLFFPVYYCYAREIGDKGTPHIHIYIRTKGGTRFSTMQRRFPKAHLDVAQGTPQECRDYIRKEGEKYADKKHTSVPGSFYEFGELPKAVDTRSCSMEDMLSDIKDGMSLLELVDKYPKYAFKIEDIKRLQTLERFEKYKKIMRNVNVTYLFGATGTGKSRSIFEKYGADEIFRITDYSRPAALFDGYNGQDVVVFEEFSGQLPIETMLNYLDIYPLELPARYNNKIACFSNVYITSNIPLLAQYSKIQEVKPETWKAFLRRFSAVYEYKNLGDQPINRADLLAIEKDDDVK